MKKLFIICCTVGFLFFFGGRVFAEDQCTSSNPCAGKEGDAAVSCYQSVVDSCKNTKDTLSSQINYLNSQIQLTTFQIESIKRLIASLTLEINQLADEVQSLEVKLTKQTELLQKRVPESYKEYVASSDLTSLFFSKNIAELIQKMQYMKKVQQQDLKLFVQYKATQNNYAERKAQREEKKTKQEQAQRDLEIKSTQLAQQKQAKNALLEQTKGQESIYQSLLADAKAKLAGFASFADSQGASLLSGQTHCDDWGCYYNQRDSQWGNALINGQSSGCVGACTIARVGCLITSVSMVVSHLGHKDVLPSDIASSSPDNFSVGTAMLMRGSIYVKGLKITRTGTSLSPDSVKDAPVIVGVYSGPFGTHFVVIKSYKDGKYIMNDPYVASGYDKTFSDYYSLGSVFEVDRVTIN